MKPWEALKALEEGAMVRKKTWGWWGFITKLPDGLIVNEDGVVWSFEAPSVNEVWELYTGEQK
jgi:hypothetical protein